MRKIIIAGLAVLMALGAVLGAVLGSAANPARAATTSASTARHELAGVSCVSADFCAAVGDHQANAQARLLPSAMIWNGTRWRGTGVRLPNGWLAGSLADVSCPSTTYCVAVGNYTKNKSIAVPVAVTWNGRVWTAARALPGLAGGRSFPVGVSCPAARHCAVAVAANPTPKSGQAFIDVLTGATWAAHPLTPPKGSMASFSGGVSCVSVTHCVVTGIVYSPRGETPLLALWNGRALSTMKAVEAFPAEFDGVSCASAKSCVGVGTWFTGAADLGYYGIWNGTIWRGARVLPQPKAMVVASMRAVSCATADRCVAVGMYRVPVKGNYPDQALAEFYNGRSWTRLSVPNPKGSTDTSLAGVSCVSATRCVAVGTADYGTTPAYSDAALTAFWNGRAWRLVTAP